MYDHVTARRRQPTTTASTLTESAQQEATR
jgi:hypothetical protein